MGTWVSSFHIAQNNLNKFYHCEQRTVRLVIPNNIDGSAIRIALSNQYGVKPVLLSGIHVALCDLSGRIDKNTDTVITAGEGDNIELHPGQELLSDKVEFPVRQGQYIAVSMYFPAKNAIQSGNSIGDYALRSTRGNFISSDAIVTDTNYSFFMNMLGVKLNTPLPLFRSLEVYTENSVKVMSAFGDSITAGSKWFSPLQKRIYEEYPGLIACGNTGISGNRLLQDSPTMYHGTFGDAGIKRFERDVMGIKGITHCILPLAPMIWVIRRQTLAKMKVFRLL